METLYLQHQYNLHIQVDVFMIFWTEFFLQVLEVMTPLNINRVPLVAVARRRREPTAVLDGINNKYFWDCADASRRFYLLEHGAWTLWRGSVSG
ncbi:MAG: hypothetical protein ACLVHS_07850 [Blautia wexlerae]